MYDFRESVFSLLHFVFSFFWHFNNYYKGLLLKYNGLLDFRKKILLQQHETVPSYKFSLQQHWVGEIILGEFQDHLNLFCKRLLIGIVIAFVLEYFTRSKFNEKKKMVQ